MLIQTTHEPIDQGLLNHLEKCRHVVVKFYQPRRFMPCIISSHQLTIIIHNMQLDIKFTLNFVICFSMIEAMKYFLNPTKNTIANKSKMLLGAELKGMLGAPQLIAYPCPSGRTMLQRIMMQNHTHYTYQIQEKTK